MTSLWCRPTIQEGLGTGEAEAEASRLEPRPSPTSWGPGTCPCSGKVIKANREQFDDMFASNRQVDEHLNPLVVLRNQCPPQGTADFGQDEELGRTGSALVCGEAWAGDRSAPAPGDIAGGAIAIPHRRYRNSTAIPWPRQRGASEKPEDAI